MSFTDSSSWRDPGLVDRINDRSGVAVLKKSRDWSALNSWCFLHLAAFVLLAATGTRGVAAQDIVAPIAPITSSPVFASSNGTIRFLTDFPGGKIDQLAELQSDQFEILISPEVAPINNSAWYAFRVDSDLEQTATVRIKYEVGSHRYTPKYSLDRQAWVSVEDDKEHRVIVTSSDRRSITLQMSLTKGSVWVAGQELLSNQDISQWIDGLIGDNQVSKSEIGKSVDGRPIYKFAFGNEEAGKSIFLLSRQHPPEVTGTIGLQAFVERLLVKNELANEFRQTFFVVVVPVANPDGVARGYWRTNANGVDMNRDWQFFREPETKALHDEILRLNQHAKGRLWLFLDFHSTYEELFYTPPLKNKLFPPDFTADWLNAIDTRLTNFDVLREPGHNAHRTTSKAWVANNLGIHAITYEFGDETDRTRISKIAHVSADEMMKLLLSSQQEVADIATPAVANE